MLRPARPVCLELLSGDLLTLTNTDGATPVRLLALDDKGENDFAAIGLSENPLVSLNVEGACVDTASSEKGVQCIRQWYSGRGSNERFVGLRAVRVFDRTSTAQETFTIRTKHPVTLWLLVDPLYNLTEQHLFSGGMGGAVAFEHCRNGQALSKLPEPLGDVREEFTVKRGTAQSYTVEQGELIQIIDVDGQQCTDFMAMNADATSLLHTTHL